ncbi:MAG: Asp-tRNA(Asn)/Glu-tRNA(Gln) amidotransferase GatCAB subunit A [Candidatus Doudnabacteria bacterium CG10_big_fil_rev_8_21_14_0_10_42_18]|uniref:Glutamyl-tRNA(Gln) amidotransferase subunit A n=1 Tax=Candidatus Doudnabacteria bacterium CG10_big_fil_rev_8_21_14_0_10_42_18 TaxID=1974552 RepID=A0A2H0VC36_9BACT|nr:MAG: Asp-tRNA(Asn)/Glu-tRNA(Gln) amidotransferase GatCAB subunit A [Candidatus Doudnabacteria bacterium CG10_big_fil_rev_8_21_14_0_10_42_18]
MQEEFAYKSLAELRELLDSKSVSSVELTKYFLDRIKRAKDLNAFITVCEEESLIEAKNADEFMASPGDNPFLCGIPYAAKDLFCTRGVRTTAGSKILDRYIPPYDATVTKIIKEQKGVLIGKTNLDEFAHGSSTETSAYGSSKNPWDKNRIPGGSSGGSAAAVGTGLVPWATATETGGSIRQPASLCGISGWKPTYGRVSRYGVISMGSSLDSIGAIAYSIEGLASIAEIISGQDNKDSTTGHEDVPKYRSNLNSDMKGLKLGIPKQYFIEGMNEDLKQRVWEAIKELEKLGAKIVDVDLPNTKYGAPVYAIVCTSEVASNLARFDGIRYGHVTAAAENLEEVYSKSRGEGFGNEAKRRVMTGTYMLSAGYSDEYYKRAQKVRHLIIDEFAGVFKKVDALVCPSVPDAAPIIGKAKEDPLFGYIADQLNIPSSLAGLPAVSVPCGFVRPKTGETPSMDGLPVGLQIIGPQWGEQIVFNVGYAYQQATDWHKKHPNLE